MGLCHPVRIQGGWGGLGHVSGLGEIHRDTKVQLLPPTSVLSRSPLRTDWGTGHVRVFSYSKAADLFAAPSREDLRWERGQSPKTQGLLEPQPH